MFDLVIRRARVATCAGLGASGWDRLGVLDRAAIGIRGGRITWVGLDVDAPAAPHVLDADGRVVLPGLVDPHTHLVFAGSRVDELARKLAGEDYRAIAAAGGGIVSSVRATRAASDDLLHARARGRALSLRSHGVTTVEVKSGYGLTPDDELRSLAVGRWLEAEGIVRTTTTLLAAHAIPPEWKDDRAGYIGLVIERMLPMAAHHKYADACDVYLDEGAFTAEEAWVILSAALKHGLRVKAHVGQFRDLGGAELVARLGGLSCDHLEEVSNDGLEAMSDADVIGVLLPGAWRTLRQRAPDAARMRAHGVSIAVGTDCNPGTSACTDLPLCAALAVRDAGLTLEEAVLGVTRVAADALGLPDVGRITAGAHADLTIWDHDDPRIIAYAMGGLAPDVVIMGGRIVQDGRIGRLW